jgi:glycosyltransferase involved in cell wall biosynthesis
MDKKRILIVAAVFYPSISPRSMRATELAKELARQGHEVHVYLPESEYDYTDFLHENPIQIKSLGKLTYKAIELNGNRVSLLFRKGLRRAMGLLFEYPGIELMFKVSKYLKKESGYDMLISIAVPFTIHWGVAKARSRRNPIATTWVADCGDPYMGDTTDSFRKPIYFKYIEKWFSRKADYITIPIEAARPAYYQEFQDKIRVIPQGFRLDKVNLPEYRKEFTYPVFAYAGGFIPGMRDPRRLLEYLSEREVQFQWIVYTGMTDLLEPYQEALGEKLVIREYIPREELLKVLSQMDFLINIDNNTHTQLPSKLIDYAITGRPVFNISSDTDFSLLMEFFKGNYAGKMDLAPPGDYDIRTVTSKFLLLQTEDS